jgi:putative FmdB family regulatory protein
MPIYEYRCKDCGHEFEEFMHVGMDAPKCLKCSGLVQRKISNFLGIIKGSEHRLLDCVVGEDADRRRNYLEKRKQKRKQKEGV